MHKLKSGPEHKEQTSEFPNLYGVQSSDSTRIQRKQICFFLHKSGGVAATWDSSEPEEPAVEKALGFTTLLTKE